MKRAILFSALSLPACAGFCEIDAVWLTYNAEEPSRIVLNWTTSAPSESRAEYGATAALGSRIVSNKKKTLHFAEIPLSNARGEIFYKISGGGGAEFSAKINKLAASGVFKAAVLGNLGYVENVDFGAIAADKPDIVFTCGDNIRKLCGDGGEWDGSLKPFELAIKRFPRSLLASTPLMPITGNHDKEIHPRGKKYPPKPAYDSSASGFKKFFRLPGAVSFWKFSVPRFGAEFLALDVCHIGDFGTTWQACQPFGADSEQFLWYKNAVEKSCAPFVFTLMNERNQDMRLVCGKIWGAQFAKTSCVVSGFGNFIERAEVGGVPFFNTSLKGETLYPDKFSKFIRGEGGYLLLTFEPGKNVKAEIKSLSGKVLDASEIKAAR